MVFIIMTAIIVGQFLLLWGALSEIEHLKRQLNDRL